MFLLTFAWLFIFFCNICFLRYKFNCRRNNLKRRFGNKTLIGFFHPYCNAGGGGERVLWTAIRAIQNRYPGEVKCVVYTGDFFSKSAILGKVKDRFNITFENDDVDFVYLRMRTLVDAKSYPFFTLALQSIGSMGLGCEALLKLVPDIFIDSMGYAFVLPIFKYFGGCRTGCYIHYPTISTDMLSAVSDQRTAVHNRGVVTRSKWLSSLKLVYYRLFSFWYGFIGSRAEVVMVNSSWTRGHINSIWECPSKTFLVYPPCDVTEFANIKLPVPKDNNHRIVSVAQFRPEKDHAMQIRAFHKLLERLNDKGEHAVNVKLVLIGGCRDKEDQVLVTELKNLCDSLGIAENVEFKVNVKFSQLLSEMANASIALHTMWNEHFGIGVVECMSAGLITIAHDSGGPKMDIIVDYEGEKTGFLASDANGYADAIQQVLRMNVEEQTELRERARKSAERFSVQNFEQTFLDASQPLFL